MTGLGSKTNCDIDTHEENRTLMSFNGNECCWSAYRWILLELICNSIVLLASQNSFFLKLLVTNDKNNGTVSLLQVRACYY
jgi:hypothetical protein